MRRAFVLLFTLSIFAFAQSLNPRIKPGSSVYIEPMNGFAPYLVAAITNAKKPKDRILLVVVTEKEKAKYIITGEVHETAPGKSGRKVDFGQTNASLSVIDAHSSQVVFAKSVFRNSANDFHGVAGAWAKHLREFIADSEK